jgi:hypothetical protein
MSAPIDQLRAELCGALNVPPQAIANHALAGHHVIYETGAFTDSAGRLTNIFNLDAGGGFLLQGISGNAPTPSTANPTFQIIDAARNRTLFSRYCHVRLFRQRGPNAISTGDEGIGGACVGRLPRPYYFRPGSQIIVQTRTDDPNSFHGHRVYLHGYRFKGGQGGPPLPDPKHEFHVVRVVTPDGDTGGIGSLLVEDGQRFHLTQICALPTPGLLFAPTERLQITDTRLSRPLFEQGPLPLNLFAAPVGPRWRLHHPYTFEPLTTIRIDLANIWFQPGTPSEEVYGLYLVGWREWLR